MPLAKLHKGFSQDNCRNDIRASDQSGIEIVEDGLRTSDDAKSWDGLGVSFTAFEIPQPSDQPRLKSLASQFKVDDPAKLGDIYFRRRARISSRFKTKKMG